MLEDVSGLSGGLRIRSGILEGSSERGRGVILDRATVIKPVNKEINPSAPIHHHARSARPAGRGNEQLPCPPYSYRTGVAHGQQPFGLYSAALHRPVNDGGHFRIAG
jgi:hypothetical protein